MRTPGIVTVAAHLPFLDVVAQRWCDRVQNDPEKIGSGTLILPGRRAAAALSEAFLRHTDGRATLLPDIRAITALDEAVTALRNPGALSLPPAVSPLRRQAVLTRLVLQVGESFGTRQTLDQAWPLAGELASLMDEAEWAGVDLARVLPDVVEDHLAQHWQVTLKFLRIVTEIWPEWLKEEGLVNPVARQVALLRAQETAGTGVPDEDPVWAVGFTDAMPATVSALRGVLKHPNGKIICPAIDFSLSDESFSSLPESHPQAGLSRLLADLDAGRGDVERWDEGQGSVPPSRADLISRVMLPAGDLSDWADRPGKAEIDGIWKISAQDQQEEAASIAMAIRGVLQTPGKRVALVTPDRGLAARVAAELARWDIAANDSAGIPLTRAPAAVLLRLLAQNADNGTEPVTLLSLLKHPLTACGLSPGNCRASARLAEREILRGPAPPPGIDGLRRHRLKKLEQKALRLGKTEEKDESFSADLPWRATPVDDFLDRLEKCLEPLFSCCGKTVPVSDLLRALLETAENICTTDEESGAERLWRGEDGEALAQVMSELLVTTDILPDQPVAVLDGLLTAVLSEQRVAVPRALPGETLHALHPRVSIWGLTESRLQNSDVLILGGLSEGVWPEAADPGPWLSRPMRKNAGLPSPERATGQAAHDFTSMFCAAPEVILSCPARRENAPAIPARWLVRMEAFLKGRGQVLQEHPVTDWIRQIDAGDRAPVPVSPPQARPPVRKRPRSLNITDIEVLLKDPYAIYAKYVLGLRRLQDISEDADASDFGNIVHNSLERWFSEYGNSLPADARSSLSGVLTKVLNDAGLRPALAAFWRPRMMEIASFVAGTEVERRREKGVPVAVYSEVRGNVLIPHLPAGDFHLRGRADRVDISRDGSFILHDYKTGSVPSQENVRTGWNPQMPLEAAMIRRGGFSGVSSVKDEVTISEMLYWSLTGDPRSERVSSATGDNVSPDEISEEIWEKIIRILAIYDHPASVYLSVPHPGREPRFADYALLARVPEWSSGNSGGED
ncbi:double-strand break repair protein AddB [Acetobacter sp. AN02]|uniref:double-strand break repair protein AddB n=1 Tax=Acetobacter sp. AN02 TaxID=2894186 RepID=UPI0024340EED|nr:double-strand break repair protein AddB [Acetobacter sp. AN02]MDG6094499.1 double-strand break repair protein AddB [Acetobacter sp. AN02]